MTDRANPKDLMGVTKPSLLSVIPPASLLHEGLAMHYGAHLAPKKDGTRGYGPYNWRENDVKASIYVDAIMRHLLAWWDGEECASDSGAHHLGHLKACAGILLDAMEQGCIVYDRPLQGKTPEILERFKGLMETMNKGENHK